MKLFECSRCGLVLYFENVRCERCQAPLGYVNEPGELVALTGEDDSWAPIGAPEARYRYCANQAHGVCNWLVPADAPAARCVACQLNRTIPALDNPEALVLWGRLETAKHRLVYTLLQLGLPLQGKDLDPEGGIAFDFLSDPPGDPDSTHVLTGHADGVITINIAEADPVRREQLRTRMHEPYRTLLGHFRHEIGHYYWDRLVRPDKNVLDAFRNKFGDERRDYGEALAQYYEQGPRQDWQQAHVSAYATAHPWEDWAETWAHYLHIVDTLETANAFGVHVRPKVDPKSCLAPVAPLDPFDDQPFADMIAAWFPVTAAVNSLNRSMGQPDLYPFVLSPKATEKLAFVHRVIAAKTQTQDRP